MIILGLDTATGSTSVAVSVNGILVGEIIANYRQTHSEKLVYLIDEVLKIADLKLENVDYYACTNGPGSFTGLRIGAASVKGMAQFFDKKIIGVSLLELLARNTVGCNGIICSIIDAQRDNLYAGFYKWEVDGLKSIGDDRVISIKELEEYCSESSENILILGDGIKKLTDEIKSLKNIRLLDSFYGIPRASMICSSAQDKINNEKDIYSWEEFEPDYFRKSQAELQMEARKDNKHEQV
ncbi:tRNA (adenosine(37)-N6)-threonylcarbamoyltransferase complex dimerization subunit type 1 TsaB [Alkalibacter mobilis]|uniref:tRNA (adenosine(37)-N6)-threonylcarbamoyltransferase complex dimerization subunit type 1 TsaB n=1 Tax=Alkalibacter mobilis TaxID=2787712 RepID=UPI00189D7B40|nr:tRNA (adenosine(37)-N6)-threonylcarbamoyltransferase complex dimerization subunit type 1 TsaB [Alkalibacter mobilis]MBF7096600.1 tRNA (adenosine(37)-N6)-threonylcarbamoyltransferase complex dimerization subunit type 1 TsaB [Alkalibacter mobilis]